MLHLLFAEDTELDTFITCGFMSCSISGQLASAGCLSATRDLRTRTGPRIVLRHDDTSLRSEKLPNQVEPTEKRTTRKNV